MSLFQQLGSAEPWMQWASCADVDPEAFFPEKGGSTRAAKRICEGCAVQPECLACALKHREWFGIYGGKSPRERARMAKEMRL